MTDPTWERERNHFKTLIDSNIFGINKKELKMLNVLKKIHESFNI